MKAAADRGGDRKAAPLRKERLSVLEVINRQADDRLS
jgi:hypothetical protein